MYRRREDWTWCDECQEETKKDWLVPSPTCEHEYVCEHCYIFITENTCTLCEDKIYPQEEVVNDDTFKPSRLEVKRVAHKICWEYEHEYLPENPDP